MNTTTTPTHSATKTTETLDGFFSLWRHLIPSDEVSLTAASTLRLLLASGPLRLTVLAEHETVSQPAMTGLVGRLEAAALVVRRPDPSDGRAVLVELTDAGASMMEDRRVRRAAALEHLLGLLDQGERARFDAAIPALSRLIDRADTEDHRLRELKERS